MRVCNVCGKQKKDSKFKHERKKTCIKCETYWWRQILRAMVMERRLTPVERRDTTSEAPGQNKRASKRMGRKRMSNENPDLPGAIRIGRQRESKRDYSPTPAQMSSTNLEQTQTQSKSSSQLTETSSTELTKESVIEAKLVEDYEDEKEKRKEKEYQDIVVATVDTGNPIRRRLCGVLVVIILAAIIFGVVRLTTSSKPSGVVADDEELPLVYDPPTADDCEAIANGEQLFNQTEAIQEPLYVSTDVSFVSEGYDMESLLPDLSDAMKQYFAPTLAGCFDKDRRRNLRRRLSRNPKFSVLNTDIELEYDDDNECNFDSPKPCYRIIVKLNLYLKGQEYISDLMSLIYGYGRDPPLVETLRLDDDASPYTSIIFAAINQP